MNRNSKNESAVSSHSILQKTERKTAKEDNVIVYSNPARPLDFSFKGVKIMEDLIKLEPRNGVRKSIDENTNINKNEEEKNKNNHIILFFFCSFHK